MNRFNVSLALLLLVAVGGGLAYKNYSSLSHSKESAAEHVALRRTVSALGRIRPLGGILNVGADASRRVERLGENIVEDLAVHKGDILAYLDHHEEMTAALRYAESQYEGGRLQLEARRELEKANIARAETDLESLQATQPRSLQIQQTTVEKLQIELLLAQKEADRYERMFKQSSGSREDHERKSTEAAQRAKALETAEAELRKMKTSQPLELAKATQTLEAARAALKVAEASIDLPSLARNVELARLRPEGTLVRAPVDGRIIKVQTRAGEVVRNQTILIMADLSAMGVVAEVYEADLPRLRTGQTVTVRAAALPEALSGRVDYVGRLVDKQTVFDLAPAAATDARVAAVRIRLDRNEPADRLVNMQVTVAIDVEPAAASSAAGSAP